MIGGSVAAGNDEGPASAFSWVCEMSIFPDLLRRTISVSMVDNAEARMKRQIQNVSQSNLKAASKLRLGEWEGADSGHVTI